MEWHESSHAPVLDRLTLDCAYYDIKEFINHAASQEDKGQGELWDDPVINSCLDELEPLLGKEF